MGHEAVTILHISDMQFGKYHRFAKQNPGSPPNQYENLKQRLLLDLDYLLGRDKVQPKQPVATPDLLVCTGDLAEWGLKKEFDEAFDFLGTIADHLQLTRDRVAVIPGNHDINRKQCEAYFVECDANDVKPEFPWFPKWKQYKEAFDDFYRGFPVSFTVAEPWTLFEIPELSVLIAGMNSTMDEGHDEAVNSLADPGHHGLCTEAQFRWFKDRLNRAEFSGWLRLGAVHHNVVRGRSRDNENLRDAELLESILGDSLDLVLHGHTHHARADVLNRLRVYATGSSALRTHGADVVPGDVPNQYQIITIRPSSITRHARRYNSAASPPRWIGDTSISDSGDDSVVTDNTFRANAEKALATGLKTGPSTQINMIHSNTREQVNSRVEIGVPINVAVSYSWKEEREGKNAGAVEAFCDQIRKAGASVVRDVDRVKHGDSLSKFMQSIGASDFLCVFLSDGYLKSPNCMYELLIAWQRSKDNPDEFRKRVKVWVMPGSVSIHRTEQRLEYTKHWQTEGNRVLPLIKELAMEAPGEVIQYRRIRDIAQNVNDMLIFFSDLLSPGSVEEFRLWIAFHTRSLSPEYWVEGSGVSQATEFPVVPPVTGEDAKSSSSASNEGTQQVDEAQPSAVAQAISEAELAAAFESTLAEIEDALNENSVVQNFLERATSGVVQNDGERCGLSAQVRNQEFSLVKSLEAISKKIATFVGSPDDWRILGDIVGGLVVLGIDREWVVKQRQAARTASAEFPADDETIRLGQGRQANLLHLVSSALADSRARLEKVFGKPPLDEFVVPDVASVLKGITDSDRQHAVKLHFIRYVLDKEQQIDEANQKQVDILFNRTKKVIASAFNDDHTPYVATGPNFRSKVDMIRKELKIEDLLLIYPSGDDPEALLQDNVRVLKFLGNIFDAVTARTSK